MLHGMKWTAAVLIALAVQAAAGTEPHWSGWDLDTKFKAIEKQLHGVSSLRELQARDRSTMRRIAEIESTLRDVRTSVKELDRRLRAIDSTLTDIQKGLAAARSSTPKPAPVTEPAKVGVETPAGPEGPLAELVDERSVRKGGFVTITGQVRNISKRPLTFIVVQATFLDAQSNVVKTESAYTSPRVIGPGASAAFRIHTPSDHRVRRQRLSVQAR